MITYPKPKDSAQKDDKYFLSTAKYYWGMFETNNTFVHKTGHFSNNARRLSRSIYELRAHARGSQDNRKYKDILDPIIREGKKKGHRRWNISWDTVKILPKFRRLMLDKIQGLIMIPMADAFDQLADFERAVKENYLRISVSESTKAMVGANEAKQDMMGVETEEDIDFLSKTGGIKIPVEIGIKDAIDVSMKSSHSDVVMEMLSQDVVDINAYACDVVEKYGVLQPVYVDFAKVISAPSIYPDFRDSDYRGYISFRTVSDILSEANNLSPTQIEAIKKQAKHSFMNDGDIYSEAGQREHFVNHTSGIVEGCNVLKMYFVVYEEEKYVVGKHRSGTNVFERVPDDFKLSEREATSGRKRVDTYPIGWLYQLNWVIGTDVVFNCGKVNWTVRGGHSKSKIKFPMVLYAGHEPSFIENCIASDDDLQLSVFKLRNTIKKIPPGPRMWIDKSMLSDTVSIGKETIGMAEMIKTFMHEGIGFYEGTGEYAIPGEEIKKRSPFQFQETGALEDINIYRQEIKEAIEFIRQQTGLNEFAEGTANQSNILNGVMQSFMQVASSANQPYIRLYVKGYRDICDYIGSNYQLQTLLGEKEVYIPGGSRRVKLESNILSYSFSFDVKVETPERLQFLRQMLYQQLETLPKDALFMIENAINDGDIMKAQYLMARYEKQAREKEKQDTIDIQVATSEANAQAAERASQAKQVEYVTENDMKKDFELFKSQLEKDAADEKLRRDKEFEKYKQEQLKEKEIAVVRANNTNRLQQ